LRKTGAILATISLVALAAFAVLAPGGLILRLAIAVPVMSLGAAGIALSLRAGPKARDARVGMAELEPVGRENPADKAIFPDSPSAPLSSGIVAIPPAATTAPDTAFYDAALGSLFKSIVTYLNGTSDPMSESLVKIREAITEFLRRMRSEQLEFERNDYATRIGEAVEQFKNQLASLTGETAETFKALSVEVDSIGAYMESIRGLLENIADVAERVHVLSINASIESARAGERGRGFKVISNEIQKLARETQRIVQDITGTVAVSNRVFASISEAVSSNRGRLLDEMARDSDSYDAVKASVDRQMGEVTGLYAHVMDFVNALEIDIKTLSPLAMLHSIVTQEIENLDGATRDFVATVRDAGSDPKALAAAMEPGRASTRIRDRLTTARELDALEQAIAACGLAKDIQLQRTNTDVEFF